jgi:hypothetical protein
MGMHNPVLHLLNSLGNRYIQTFWLGFFLFEIINVHFAYFHFQFLIPVHIYSFVFYVTEYRLSGEFMLLNPYMKNSVGVSLVAWEVCDQYQE